MSVFASGCGRRESLGGEKASEASKRAAEYYQAAAYPKTGEGMATGHVPVKKELGHVKEDFRGPLTHSNERLG